MRLRSIAVLAGTCATSLLTALAVPSAAHASFTIGTPAGERWAGGSSSSVSISLNPSSNATSYRMWISTVKSNLYVANLTTATRSVTSSSPRLTMTGLAYTSAPVYYRILAMRGTSHSWGGVHVTGMTPAAPTGLRVTTGANGLYLNWNNQDTSSYGVTQATDAAMTQNRVTRYLYGRHLQYTPYGLTPGVRYYFQVRARNYGPLSGMSAQVSAIVPKHQRTARILTFNLLSNSFDGTVEGGQHVGSWSSRKPKAVELIRRAVPDIVDMQEGSGYVGSPQGYGGRRMVDDLVASMPEFGLARTEVPPTEHGYYRVGDYIAYRKSTFRPYGSGNHWYLGNGVYCAYQVLQNIATGAKVLVVSPHLVGGLGVTADTNRQNEAATMIRYATSLATSQGATIVYAGDFNSDTAPGHYFDGPGRAMQPAATVDARDVALNRYNDNINSANQYLRTPPAFGYSIDYIYTGPGVAVLSWGVEVILSGGKFIGTMASDHNPVWATIALPY